MINVRRRIFLSQFSSYFKSLRYDSSVCKYNFQRGKIIDGRAVASNVLCALKNEIEKWIDAGNEHPNLTAVAVGSNPASNLYLRNKGRAADKCGVTSNVIKCPENVNENELIELICNLNSNESIDAILLQLPLPEHLNLRKVIDNISVIKDVDGFTSFNMTKMFHNETGIVPCSVLAVHEIIRQIGRIAGRIMKIELLIKKIIDIRSMDSKGCHATVVGTSQFIGLPIALSLHSQYNPATGIGLQMTTTLCNINTTNELLRNSIEKSDVIVSATGVPGIIKGDMIKEGSVVIDVGTTFLKSNSGKVILRGDVEFEKALSRASYITPVPGGVGPVTVAMLMKNTFLCARLRKTSC